MAHTPGPWNREACYFDIQNICHRLRIAADELDGAAEMAEALEMVNVRTLIHIESRNEKTMGEHICSLPKNSIDNANLIAAAPDLLEACKNIENDDGSIPASIWKMLQDAISKAEGK